MLGNYKFGTIQKKLQPVTNWSNLLISVIIFNGHTRLIKLYNTPITDRFVKPLTSKPAIEIARPTAFHQIIFLFIFMNFIKVKVKLNQT